MKPDLLFDFSLDKENKTIRIKREFNASLASVWQAWTTAGLLDKWWAPKPYHIETKLLDLRVDGMWLYAMVSPKNEKMWCKADYKAIETNKLLSWLDAFCDENGTENTIKPRSLWITRFSEINGITTVNIALQHDKPGDVEMMIGMGFKEGFSMALGNLDELFSNLKN
jgi:uncharacterized protein YndB with AHSA1/START domain